MIIVGSANPRPTSEHDYTVAYRTSKHSGYVYRLDGMRMMWVEAGNLAHRMERINPGVQAWTVPEATFCTKYALTNPGVISDTGKLIPIMHPKTNHRTPPQPGGGMPCWKCFSGCVWAAYADASHRIGDRCDLCDGHGWVSDIPVPGDIVLLSLPANGDQAEVHEVLGGVDLHGRVSTRSGSTRAWSDLRNAILVHRASMPEIAAPPI